MARLSANGPCVLRVSIERMPPETAATDWERVTYSYHRKRNNSPIVRLSKRDVRFRGDKWSTPRRHCYGWKRDGRLKSEITVQELRDRYTSKGWTIERGGEV